MRVGIERGERRTFAWAVDWPGWCRAGRDEELALAALLGYADRYGRVCHDAGVPPATDLDPEVVVRVPGTTTTDVGAPGVVAGTDHEPMTRDEAARHSDLVAAAWRALERAAANSAPVLQKGPRGGGRDRDDIVEHVREAERAYARRLGVRYTPTQFRQGGALQSMRSDILAVLCTSREVTEDTAWPARYAARRIAWHALDHAWEIEDKQPS